MHRSLAPLAVLTLAFAAACADGGPTQSAAPPADGSLAPLRAAPAEKAIPGQYIVVLEDGANPRSVAAVAGVEPGFVYTAALTGFSAALNQGQLNAVRRMPGVAYVEEDAVASIATTQSNATWGLDRIDQRDRPLNGTYIYTPTGAGVRAYVIDTGILTSHTNFGGRAQSGYTSINDGRGSSDCNGHGTHVAGTIGSTTYGVAKGVTLIAVRVLDCQGSGTNSGVIAGMDWVTANHVKPAVANMSLGGGASTATDDAVNRMHNAGVTVVVAAGNESTNACNSSPARAANAITVGSTTSTDARSSFSNYGSCLDIFAPGSSITSTWHTSTSATSSISGTSMASPHVAGVAALYLQGAPSASPATVAAAIINTSSTGKVSSAGTGSPNRLLYSPLSGGGTTPTPTPGYTYTGSLSGTGDADVQPNGTYYQSTSSGAHTAQLSGPSSADFDLSLYRWNGSSWSRVALSESASSTESITYNGSAGYYYWRVYSYSGSGSYTLVTTRP